ncbi:Homocysteine S-methyltransferase [Stachybotrys elegans]|uniref:Homocysteine S-methyltransferase n=1 Tax=Stachybotrys elegans TaxID=80388 RepID=A0A8K0WRM4_9HYPO|nr:Homocysteine S-methyltransferase [Stachybotrys elegans]
MPRVRILDGGLGTSLEHKYGVCFSHQRPLWSSDLIVSDPKTLLECQSDFGNVPVDILTTATYQVSLEGFAATTAPQFPDGVDAASIPPFLDTALSIAAQAKRPEAAVALGLGPYGACMVPSQEYSGAYDSAHNSVQSLLQWHEERLRLFTGLSGLKDRIGILALETVPRVDEIVAIRKAISRLPELAGVPFWISCLYPGDDGRLPDGTSAEDAITAMLGEDASSSRPWGIGINCTKVEKLDGLVRNYESAVSKLAKEGKISQWPALVLYPDGTRGEVYNTTTQQWEVADTASSAERAAWETVLSQVVRDASTRGNWAEIIVGGCCRSSSDDIAKLRNTLQSQGLI